jgi:RimJ/RimL family protein N-acetyltransferase
MMSGVGRLPKVVKQILEGAILMGESIEMEGARLLIREVAPDDLPLLLPVYLSNPEYVVQSEGSRGVAGYYDLTMFQRDWQIAQMTPGRHLLGIYLKETGEAIGLADYLEEHSEDGQPWLGMLMIARAHQRQGLGSEACKRLVEYLKDSYGWSALRVAVMKTNTKALAFWRRLDFQAMPATGATEGNYLTLQRAL